MNKNICRKCWAEREKLQAEKKARYLELTDRLGARCDIQTQVEIMSLLTDLKYLDLGFEGASMCPPDWPCIRGWHKNHCLYILEQTVCEGIPWYSKFLDWIGKRAK